MDIVNFLNTSLGNSFEAISHYNKNTQEDQESKSNSVLSYSVNSDWVTIPLAAMHLFAKAGSGGQGQSESESAGSAGARAGGGSNSTDNEWKTQELQSKLQGLKSRLAAAMQKEDAVEAGAIQGQISAVIAQIAALQASEA